MTKEERNIKLKHLITCMKCEVSGKVCDANCPTQYEAGNMGEIIENLKAISKMLEQEPCDDCISRQAVMNALCDGCELFKNGEQTCRSKCEEYHFLATLSSVTSQPKIGHWYKSSCDICYTCSFCGVTNASGTRYNYCPHCGAKMEEVEE